jgi:hypothetical protein
MAIQTRQFRDLGVLKVVEKHVGETPEALERLLRLKQSLKELGYAFEAPGEELVKGACDSNVCVAVVCAFSTSCDGAACASNGCAALVDHCGFFSNDNPCSKATCTNQSCGTGTGGGNCGQRVCSYKV